MKTGNRIIGIVSLVLSSLCLIPSIIGIFVGILEMNDSEILNRIISTILFEFFLFIGGLLTTIMPSKPVVTIFSSTFLGAAGILQIIFSAEFSLAYESSISLLILSWVATICIIFCILLLTFSILTIVSNTKKSNTDNQPPISSTQTDISKPSSEELLKNEPLSEQKSTKDENDTTRESLLNPSNLDQAPTQKRNTIIKNKKNLLLIISICLAVCVILIGGLGLSLSFTGKKPNSDEQKLINYILENGEYDSEKKIYSINESTMESGIYFNYIIEYSKKTKKLTFKENSYISDISSLTSTTMYYEYGEKEQKVEVIIGQIESDVGIKSSGIIRPATYTSSNRTIHSFESTYTNQNMQTICENNVYTMLYHCQLLMIDADTGLVPFGFEKGLYK